MVNLAPDEFYDVWRKSQKYFVNSIFSIHTASSQNINMVRTLSLYFVLFLKELHGFFRGRFDSSHFSVLGFGSIMCMIVDECAKL